MHSVGEIILGRNVAIATLDADREDISDIEPDACDSREEVIKTEGIILSRKDIPLVVRHFRRRNHQSGTNAKIHDRRTGGDIEHYLEVKRCGSAVIIDIKIILDLWEIPSCATHEVSKKISPETDAKVIADLGKVSHIEGKAKFAQDVLRHAFLTIHARPNSPRMYLDMPS